MIQRKQMSKVVPEGCQTLKIQIWTLTTFAAEKFQGGPKVARVPSVGRNLRYTKRPAPT